MMCHYPSTGTFLGFHLSWIFTATESNSHTPTQGTQLKATRATCQNVPASLDVLFHDNWIRGSYNMNFPLVVCPAHEPILSEVLYSTQFASNSPKVFTQIQHKSKCSVWRPELISCCQLLMWNGVVWCGQWNQWISVIRAQMKNRNGHQISMCSRQYWPDWYFYEFDEWILLQKL